VAIPRGARWCRVPHGRSVLDPSVMQEVACAHCGAMMSPDAACPVCELPAAAAPSSVPMTASPLARWWANGQVAVAGAAGLFLGAMFLPLLRHVPMLVNRELDPEGVLTPLDLALGNYALLRGTMTAWMLPGAAILLLSLLRTRSTASAMRASRMLLAVVSLAPLLSAAMPLLKLQRRGLPVEAGPAMAVIVLGVVCGLAGAVRFGAMAVDESPAHD